MFYPERAFCYHVVISMRLYLNYFFTSNPIFDAHVINSGSGLLKNHSHDVRHLTSQISLDHKQLIQNSKHVIRLMPNHLLHKPQRIHLCLLLWPLRDVLIIILVNHHLLILPILIFRILKRPSI